MSRGARGVPHATPGPAGATSTESGAVRTYRRSLGMRIVSAACAVLFLGGAISLARAAGATAGLLILGALAALSLINLAGAFADRYTLDDEGIEYRNALLALLGRAPRRVAWDEIADVREHHRLRSSGGGPPSALFLTLRSGRRLVLDSLERYDEILDIVRRRCDTPPSDCNRL